MRAVRKHLEEKPGGAPDFRRLAALARMDTATGGEAADLLEKAHAMDPGDPEIANELAGALAAAPGKRDRAVEIYEKIAAMLEGKTHPGVDPEMYARAGREEKSLAAYRAFLKSARDTYRLASSAAHAKLGKLHEKRGEFVEAYRVYTEGIDAYKSVRERFGRTAVPRPVRRPGQQEAPEETDPAALCKALLGRLGRDYFIGEFLKGTLPALGE